MKWISVDERLPETELAALTYRPVYSHLGGEPRMRVTLNEWLGDCWFDPGVTHWMPLPEPPEGE